LYVTCGELEWLNLYSGEVHKLKYISKLHAAQVTNSPTKFTSSTKLHGATTQKAITLIKRRVPVIPKESTINFVRYKNNLLSLIVPYV